MRLIDNTLLAIARPAVLALIFMAITSLMVIRLGMFGVTTQATIDVVAKPESTYISARFSRTCGVHYHFSDGRHLYPAYASFSLSQCPTNDALPVVYDPLWPVLNRPAMKQEEDFWLYIQLNFIAMMVFAWDVFVMGRKK